jgi:anti-sigma regulatory factor (Ser/Thr protein kinase)
MSHELALEPAVESVGAGRRLVAEALAAWNLDELSYTATLLTSEVLTNSVLHARTPIVLSIERSGPEFVTICVQDQSTAAPRRRRYGQEATTGRGIELLEKLAQSWRVDVGPGGKTISFVVGGDSDPWAAFAGADWSDAEL